MQHVVGTIYQVVFIEKVTFGDRAGEIVKKMDEISRANDSLPLGTLFKCWYKW